MEHFGDEDRKKKYIEDALKSSEYNPNNITDESYKKIVDALYVIITNELIDEDTNKTYNKLFNLIERNGLTLTIGGKEIPLTYKRSGGSIKKCKSKRKSKRKSKKIRKTKRNQYKY